ncbi:MAG: DEAD/DEAH box helicase, partial [Firmicutes bacterium]|nr:DEAD/DEAH box helicase [Bacillota bacterium]
KQAAVLVPTTLLANQHYYTLKERFEKFPFKVEVMSRFRSEKQQAEIASAINRGAVDVVIGTHRLLSKDVKFKNLGLLVVDEEQRFGVQHKEAIKMLKNNVDVLTLSATPIPRTLHMSLVGIRDMSVIEEPPEERYPVQTYVLEQDDQLIREVIERELARDGQVYVLFNKVRGISRIAAKIAELVPDARVAVGHGQMKENELEKIMIDFINKETDVLVSTTIIESGIDIPNVNTILILDADKLGLAQLYQLRGRVGRSNRIAYAYLMYKKDSVLTETAEKRLRAIKEFTEFGAGFKVAMRDLEIRGAGNLLGTEQHGHMMDVGYELYCKLVDDAVRALSGEVVNPDHEEASIEIRTTAFIPSTYISDEVLKLQMYKKIAMVTCEEDEDEILDEMLDRFGDVPQETVNLTKISRIRSLAERLCITRVAEEREARFTRVVFYFAQTNPLSAEKLMNLAAAFGPRVLIHGGVKPFIRYSVDKDKLRETIEVLETLK